MSRLRPERRPDDAGVRRKLAELRRRGYNFDPADLSRCAPGDGWRRDDLRRTLGAERPGPPEPGGRWEIARRLMWGYEFADPSIVYAFYDRDEPLEGRTMLLELRFRGLLRIDVGTRVAEVYDGERIDDAGAARVWGWAYRTLEGHLEQGQMAWEVWKRLDTGRVEFRIAACSRPASDPSPILRLGFRLFGRREQMVFLHSTLERMARLTETAVRDGGRAAVHRDAETLTARSGFATAPAHHDLAARLPTP
jgi:uncharacterized protein (UPF0548 family)